MRKCEYCKIKYPVFLLQPFSSSNGGFRSVCGICALELGNEVLGVKRTAFTGEMAEEFRQKAIAWREQHP